MKKKTSKKKLIIGIIMGSESDYKTMKAGIDLLEEFNVPIEVEVVSAHRTPKRMYEYAEEAAQRGLQVIIAGAGGSAHLPGMVASLTTLPVIGVPVETKSLHGLDSLLSIVQMPPGIPVATVSIGNSKNAALLALRMISIENATIRKKLETFQKSQVRKVKGMNQRIRR